MNNRVISGSNFFKICFHTILLVGGIVLGFLFISKDINLDFLDFGSKKTEEAEKNIEGEQAIPTGYLDKALLDDLSNKHLSLNDYYKNLLFAEYNRDYLDNRYFNLEAADIPLDTDYIASNYSSKISDTVMKYYLEKVLLTGVTFELNTRNKEEKTSNIVAFADPVYADDDNPKINLNRAVLSGNGNFVVWFTDSGTSAINEQQAKEIAYSLEVARYEYDKMYKKYFKFKTEFVNEGTTHTNQLKILNKEKIPQEKLSTAMQVYVVNYTEKAAAKYVLAGAKVVEIYDKYRYGDADGSIPGPYLLIKADSYKTQTERTMQIANRELFRHYQYNIFCPEAGCVINDDPYYFDALASYGSAVATTKSSNMGFLNDWVALARANSSNILSDDLLDKYGEKNLANILFPYLYYYANNVPDGNRKLVNALYKAKPFEELELRAGDKYLAEVMQNLSLDFLRQTGNNYNLIAAKNDNLKMTAKGHYSAPKKIDEMIINKLGIDYYKLDKNANEHYSIEFGRNSAKVSCVLLGFKDGQYYPLAKSPVSTVNVQFKTSNYKEFEEYYIIITNNTMLSNSLYYLNITNE